MAISSYGAGTDSSGVVRILKDLDANIAGRDVLVMEDIIDSGLTLSYLLRTLRARRPASLEICALLTKPERREIDVPVRYVGFEIPNEFVIGYGLDYAERYRNLPYIGVLDPAAARRRRLTRGASGEPTDRRGRRARKSTLLPSDDRSMNRFFRSALFPLIVIVLLVWLASQTLIPRRDDADKFTYSRADQARSARGTSRRRTSTPGATRSRSTLASGQKVKVYYPTDQAQIELQKAMEEQNVNFDSKGVGSSVWVSLLTGMLPLLLLIGFWIFLMNQVQGGGSKVMSFGKSRAKRMSPDSPKVTYKDVAGADEAVEELQEIKEFLENPKKFQALGARIPKGVLLYGPPGTGKTLLARATAGEAGVPFFSISGSDFVEMFVGVGASRVRDLFEQAKQASPCIIFIDEIDAVGRHRGAGLGGGHDEREQTLNQLLVEMDGFELKDNIILIAATNRPDILDPALLRPGRFDRQIVVDRPDRKGRREILEVHSKGKPLAREIDLDVLAASHAGLHGRRPLERDQRGRAPRRPARATR